MKPLQLFSLFWTDGYLKGFILLFFFPRRPSGNAKQDLLAHTAPYKLKEKERLQGILSDLQSQNKLLKDAARARQSKLEHTQQKIEQKAQQWKEVCLTMWNKLQCLFLFISNYLWSLDVCWVLRQDTISLTTLSQSTQLEWVPVYAGS